MDHLFVRILSSKKIFLLYFFVTLLYHVFLFIYAIHFCPRLRSAASCVTLCYCLFVLGEGGVGRLTCPPLGSRVARHDPLSPPHTRHRGTQASAHAKCPRLNSLNLRVARHI